MRVRSYLYLASIFELFSAAAFDIRNENDVFLGVGMGIAMIAAIGSMNVDGSAVCRKGLDRKVSVVLGDHVDLSNSSRSSKRSLLRTLNVLCSGRSCGRSGERW